jgi:sn-glycerol 3-phosphate transport system permease protein
MHHTKGPRYAVHAALWLTCFIVCLPMIYALILATQGIEASFAPVSSQLRLGGDFFNNFEQLFSEENFDGILWNTLVITLFVVVAKTIVAMLAGLAFVFYRFPGRWVLFFFILLTLLMPTELILLPLFNLVAELEWGVDHPRLALSVPFLATAAGAFLFRQHFQNIPREMVEAAQLDGASPLQFLWSVLLPMSWNVLVAHSVLQFIAMWNQYLWPVLVVQSDQDLVIQQGVRNAARFSSQTDFGLLMTAGIVASLPPIILFIVLQRQFMNGFALTRDK